jgi:hypothetical protein
MPAKGTTDVWGAVFARGPRASGRPLWEAAYSISITARRERQEKRNAVILFFRDRDDGGHRFCMYRKLFVVSVSRYRVRASKPTIATTPTRSPKTGRGVVHRFACIGKIHVFVSCFAIRDRKHVYHRYHGYLVEGPRDWT